VTPDNEAEYRAWANESRFCVDEDGCRYEAAPSADQQRVRGLFAALDAERIAYNRQRVRADVAEELLDQVEERARGLLLSIDAANAHIEVTELKARRDANARALAEAASIIHRAAKEGGSGGITRGTGFDPVIYAVDELVSEISRKARGATLKEVATTIAKCWGRDTTAMAILTWLNTEIDAVEKPTVK
jgi:hypothetical protein